MRPLLNVFVRTLIVYVLLVIVTRFMGKRQLGQLQPFELVITIVIAELAAMPVGDLNIPLLYGIVPILALCFMETLLAFISFKSERARRLLNGKPIVLIKNGRIEEKELDKVAYNLGDFLEQLRAQGVLNPDEVGTAVLETSGFLSVFPVSQKRPLTPEDVQLPTGFEGVPLTLVVDGRIQSDNLAIGALSEAWLREKLTSMGVPDPKQVYLCYVTTQGMLFVQEKTRERRLHYLQALEPDRVRW